MTRMVAHAQGAQQAGAPRLHAVLGENRFNVREIVQEVEHTIIKYQCNHKQLTREDAVRKYLNCLIEQFWLCWLPLKEARLKEINVTGSLRSFT